MFLNLKNNNWFVVWDEMIIISFYFIKEKIVFILHLCLLGHKAANQGIINLAYYFANALITVLDHHSSCVDFDCWSNTHNIILNAYVKLNLGYNFYCVKFIF